MNMLSMRFIDKLKISGTRIGFCLLNKEVNTSLMLIIAAVFASYVLWFNFYAQWGLIDDHEIMFYLGHIGRWKIFDVFQAFHFTECWNLGARLRFRPFYWFFRLAEVCLWGNSPFSWYLFRYALFVGSFSIFWRISSRYVGFIPGLLFVLYVFTFDFWPDIWTRLGPGETYAVFGFALYSLGCLNVLRSIVPENPPFGHNYLNWIMMLIGAIVAMGSKENFLILLIPSFVLFVVLWKKGILGKVGFISSLFVFSYGGFIASVIMVAVTKAGHDLYRNDVNFVDRVQLLAHGLVSYGSSIANVIMVAVAKAGHDLYRNDVNFVARVQLLAHDLEGFWIISTFIFTSILFLFFCLPRRKPINGKNILKIFCRYFFISLAIILFYLSQYAFYNGNFPAHMRYDFPGMLAGPMFVLASMVFVLNIIKLYTKKSINEIIILSIFSLELIFLIVGIGYEPLRQASKASMIRTMHFTSDIARVANVLKEKPNVPLVLDGFGRASMIWEPILSVGRFLCAYGVNNPLFVEVRLSKYINELDRVSVDSIQDISTKGWHFDSGLDEHFFRPIGELKKYSHCYSADISYVVDAYDRKAITKCKHITRFYWKE